MDEITVKRIDFEVLKTPRRENITLKGAFVEFHTKYIDVVHNYRADIELEETDTLTDQIVYCREYFEKSRNLYFSLERCNEKGSLAKYLVCIEMINLEFSDFKSAKKMYDALIQWKIS